MGIFTRMSNMIKGKVNDTLDEMENPIELLDQKVRDMEEQLSKAKLNSAQVLGNVHEIKKKMDNAVRSAEDFDSKVKLAMSKGNEDLAKRALAKKVDCDRQVTTLQATYEASKIQADSLKKNLAALEAEITKTRNYRDEAAARYSTAEASKQVNEILANVQTKTNTIQIDNIERKIQRKESLAQGLSELRNVDTFDSEFEALDTVDLDLELEKYRNS
ncbi:PspA/IM30 family protein [Clostridium gasigenes]|uniref:PspA/IM30 family protein n=1 Tax=Clostridium gasigenes TaxID=94869 RepID=A0A7X0SAV8_9CLOT|nr:PspA/IM30 family protein [Clostridium gasigenes]MBB6714260.1 PspA/IM30 family protein [Clostridium gasigenes]MBU3103809.1 PspA/IM30 family protein [Clostridium gasigenes]MBU3108239.1 PspA/IM30 family protein [Clostridium gasigenes]MBU3132850.1 PspA/IM30 family protein [Clostridium gasigenes]